MAIQKYTKGEGKVEILEGREAQVLNEHFAKTGKFNVSKFDEAELKELEADLEDARKLGNPQK